jgi:hypothetical protein
VKGDVSEKLSKHYCLRFGKIAVDKGFVTAKQLNVALAEQVEENYFNGQHRPIGSILFEHDWITRKQIDIVLDILLEVVQ